MRYRICSTPTVITQKWSYGAKWIRYSCSAPRKTPTDEVWEKIFTLRFWGRTSRIVPAFLLRNEMNEIAWSKRQTQTFVGGGGQVGPQPLRPLFELRERIWMSKKSRACCA
ncbi:hypothetical protein Y032_0466g1964 [Ancylostoma ceylanicum]|uniref:Uncharacterized protein n=1 Tax=Ancylostoma ceylanicum TaxID=53326 RepID=A0A016WX70_9BILA|nr:hypothetical protein Y032_0466g1964 [Ancylostoma ceylanicum]